MQSRLRSPHVQQRSEDLVEVSLHVLKGFVLVLDNLKCLNLLLEPHKLGAQIANREVDLSVADVGHCGECAGLGAV